ncbi:LysR family transcriptional regulator [Caulobacter sp.]|uniref:LysR family transcriptional regulator n=1 Tax=Caulobacter sp. TaxID=78 RepID=UPI0031D4E03E
MELRNFGDMAAFVAAVRTGSYTKAGAQLGLSRSAVGKSIVRLEERLGARLLNRTTRSLSLTDDGQLVFERCRQILEDLEEVDASLAERRATPTGVLKLTVPISFGQRRLLPVLDAYLRRWPGLKAEVAFTDRFADIIDEGFDLAVRIGDDHSDSRFLTRSIGTQQFVVCGAPAYFQRRPAPTSPQDLGQHDTVFFLREGARLAWRFSTPQGPYGFSGPGRMALDSAEAIRASGVAGSGLIWLPTYIVQDDIDQGLLVPVLEDFRSPADPIRVIYPSKRHLSPRVRGFIDMLDDIGR